MSITIPVLYSFARSGGTLLNRCLGCIDGNVVLSEVNPHGSPVPIEVQVGQWFRLLPDESIKELAYKPYGEKIRLLAHIAEQQERKLIIRDWSTLNFLGNVFYNISFPSMVLEQELYLSRYGVNTRPTVFVRHAASVYESIIRTFAHLRNLTVQEFGVSYLAYAKAVANYPIYKLEHFCYNPLENLHKLCNYLQVNYDNSFLTKFSQFSSCTGDNTLSESSPSSKLEKIVPLKEHQESPSWLAASSDSNCQEVNWLFGYED